MLVRGKECQHSRKPMKAYTKAKHQKRRFHVQMEAIRRLEQMFLTPWRYPEFNSYQYTVKDEKGRKNRIERRFGEMLMLLPCLILHCYLPTMQIGMPAGNDFNNFNYQWLASTTGLSKSQVQRDMRHLQDYGFVTVRRDWVILNDGFKTERVIITLTEKIFELLGLSEQLDIDRGKAYKNAAKRAKRADLTFKGATPRVKGKKSLKSQISELANSKSVTRRTSNRVPQDHGYKVRDLINIYLEMGFDHETACKLARKHAPPH